MGGSEDGRNAWYDMTEKDSTHMRMLVQEDLRYEKRQHRSSQTRHRLNHREHLAVQRILHPPTLPGLSLTNRPLGVAWIDEPKREESEKCAQIAKRKEKKSDRHEWYEKVDSSCSDETEKLCSSVSDSSSEVHHEIQREGAY